MSEQEYREAKLQAQRRIMAAQNQLESICWWSKHPDYAGFIEELEAAEGVFDRLYSQGVGWGFEKIL